MSSIHFILPLCPITMSATRHLPSPTAVILGMHRKQFIRPAIGAALILLIPLIAMQFTAEVNWDHTDFIVMGGMLFITGLLIEFVASKFSGSGYRILAIAGIVIVFLLTWAELAVGLFGTPFAGS